jgi:hypothetical protein
MPQRLALLVVAVFAFAAATAQESGSGPRPECSFDPDAFPPAQRQWQRLTRTAELVAPTGRRRAVTQPPAPVVSKNFIDDEIFGKMKLDGIRWTVPASDEEFLRRVFLDLTGQTPTAARTREFLADTRTDKRDLLVDELLTSEEFVERWTVWFGDLVQNVVVSGNINVGPQGRNAFHKFIGDSLRARTPYDQLVRDVITGSGGQNTSGPANYWVRQIQTNGPIHDTWDNLSAHTGEKFLGLPLTCISCHNGIGHLEQVNTGLVYRTREDFWKNAAFFAHEYHRPQRDPASNRVEWFIEPTAAAAPRIPRGYVLNTTQGNKTPRQPIAGGTNTVEPAFFLSGEKPGPTETRRQAYARILTGHPQFARATANYIWKEIFGLGIVEPADSFDLLRQDPATLVPGAALQPTHPMLITRLADHFSGTGYDLRALLKTIVLSSTYQLSSIYTPGEWSESFTPYYARHYPRRMLAESVADAVVRATGVPHQRLTIGGGVTLQRAMQLPDPTEPRGSFALFLNAFGRGDRDSTERSREGSIVQALGMLNDTFVTTRIRNGGGSTVQRTLQATRDPATIADELYLATLSRRPTAEERAEAVALLSGGEIVSKTEDLQFALLNRLEFLYY